MRRLIGFELEKILKRKIVWVGLAALIGLNIVMYIFTGMPSVEVMNDQGGYSKGAEAIAVDRELTKPYEGVFTDDTVKQIFLDHKEKAERTNPFGTMDFAYDITARIFLDDQGNYNQLPVEDVFGEDEAMREFRYALGEQQFLNYMPMILLVLGYVLIIALSPVFSDEYMRGTDALILTSKLGKRQCAIAKVAASMLFAAILAAVIILINWLLMVIFFGTEGWDASIQVASIAFMEVPYALTVGQTVVFGVLLWSAATLGLAGLVMICSSVARTSFMTLIVTLIVYTVPLSVSTLDYQWLQRILAFMPSTMSTIKGVVSFPLVEIGGVVFNFSWLPVVALVLFAALSFPAAHRAFQRKMA